MPVSAIPATLPPPRTPDSRDAPVLRWGVLGPGWIARRFVESVQAHTGQLVTAVGSRSPERSRDFAQRYGITAAYGSYEDLVAAPDVDVVYVGTPHTHHHAAAMLALGAGKHVLVEKPVALNAAEAEDIAGAARRRGLFAAEALWTMFLPKFDVIRQVLADGLLGTVTAGHAEYGEYFAAGHRIFDPALAGGPLLDLGTYPLAFLTTVLGRCTEAVVVGIDHSSGVNAQLSAALRFDTGALGTMSTTLHNFTPTMATVVGTRATLAVDGPFLMPGGLSVRWPDGTALRHEERPGAHFEGLHFQAAAVARAIGQGLTEAPQRPLEASIQTLRAADSIRAQLGIVYPGETAPGVRRETVTTLEGTS
jgi:predicted dehydrogenase